MAAEAEAAREARAKVKQSLIRLMETGSSNSLSAFKILKIIILFMFTFNTIIVRLFYNCGSLECVNTCTESDM